MRRLEIFLDTTSWIIHNLILPLAPIGLGIVISAFREEAVPLHRLLSGTELFLLSFMVLAITKRDFEKAIANTENTIGYRFLSESILPALTYLTVVIFAVVYIHLYVEDLEFKNKIVAIAAIVTGVTTSIVSSGLRFYIVAIELSIGDSDHG